MSRFDSWTIVEQVFDKDRACRECPHLKRAREPHGEINTHCAILQQGTDPTLCPGFDDALTRAIASA